MNPSDIFMLSGYAHAKVAPFMASLNADLQIILDFDNQFAGIQVWVFNNTHNQALAHRSHVTTIEQLDELVTEVKALASVTA